ncbi:MAG TPA: AraC family transcriptional regulator [Candidatus Acidoferrales bacterium]|nr:AraC family transcriptional regulator [Candidatus Acidoferrales bacterium]
MDALSDLLRVVRFSGGVFLESNFRAPWCIRSQLLPGDCGPGVKTDGGLLGFHYVLDGHMHVRVGSQPPRAAGPGDIIILSRNDPHMLGSDLAIPPVDARPLIHKAKEDLLACLDFGKGREVKNRFVCGYLATAMRDHPLLTSLPPLLVADLRGRPCAEWAETSFRYAAREHATRRAGSQEILARLAEMLFVEAVRGYIDALPGNATGWLAALRDPSLSRALSALHLQPARAWTAEDLAKEACLSRSAFAEKFTSAVGLPPMSYLTRWRMLLAGQRLRESSDTLAQVAATVGYESEFSFSRAFARETGVTPGAWRKSGEE